MRQIATLVQHPGCALGRHRPRPTSRRSDGDVQRSVCCDCGRELKRTLATRRWFVTGLLV